MNELHRGTWLQATTSYYKLLQDHYKSQLRAKWGAKTTNYKLLQTTTKLLQRKNIKSQTRGRNRYNMTVMTPP